MDTLGVSLQLCLDFLLKFPLSLFRIDDTSVARRHPSMILFSNDSTCWPVLINYTIFAVMTSFKGELILSSVFGFAFPVVILGQVFQCFY